MAFIAVVLALGLLFHRLLVYRQGLGFRGITPMMEKQIQKNKFFLFLGLIHGFLGIILNNCQYHLRSLWGTL